MRRRSVLTAAAALLAGCSDGPSQPARSPTDRPATSSPATPTRSSEPSPSPTRTTESPTPTTEPEPTPTYDLLPPDPVSMTSGEVRERLADRDCGGLAELPVTCPGDDAELDVSVSPTIGDLSETPVEFTVENRADEHFRTNHYDWTLRKWDGDRWRRIAPKVIPDPLHRIEPGDSHTYEISRADGAEPNRRNVATQPDVAIRGLGPGVYGFTARGYFDSSPEDERAVAAAFGFAGEKQPFRPTDDVADVDRDGSRLWRADAPSRGPAGNLSVSFVDEEPDDELLAEHVWQPVALRNTLPYAATDGVDTLRYVGGVSEVRFAERYLSFVTSEDASRYGFRDLTFEVTAET